MCKKTNVTIPQFYRVLNYFFECWIAHGWTACSRSLIHNNWNITVDKQHCKTRKTSPRRLVRDRRPFHQLKKQDQNTNWKEKVTGWAIFKCGQHTLFSRRVSVVHFWRQRCCHEDDYQRTKSNNETRVQNPQSCAWLVVRQNQLGTRDPNQMCWHQKPTCWHANQREFHAWRVEPFSSFVRHDEFLDVLMQPFQQFFFLIRSESRAPCQREVKKRLPLKVHSWRSPNHWFQRRRDPSTWCYAARGAPRENPPQYLGYPVNPESVDEGQGGLS